MSGSVALDVVIGLVFIFLLYSLLASIIQEIIATYLGLRARNLKRGIIRMLEDESKGLLPKRAEKEGLLREFYAQPGIKYLASGKVHSKPSYISESDFAKALLEILKKNGGKHTATIDKIKHALAESKDLINDETRAHLVSLLEDAQYDLVKFKANLEEWFNNTMERVSGWYKRKVQIWLMLIGFGIAISFNANTIEITKLLSKDQDARDAMVELASTYMKENEEVLKRFEKTQKDGKNNPISSQNAPKVEAPDSLEVKSETNENESPILTDTTSAQKKDLLLAEFETKLDSLLEIKAELQSDIEEVNSLLGFKPVDELKIIDSLPSKLVTTSTRKIINDKYLVQFPSAFLADKTATYYRIEKKKVNGKIIPYAEFRDLYYIYKNFWGYLLTALAISLGAPFWFDLLSKLIRIRSSIQSNSKNKSGNVPGQGSSVPLNQRVG